VRVCGEEEQTVRFIVRGAPTNSCEPHEKEGRKGKKELPFGAKRGETRRQLVYLEEGGKAADIRRIKERPKMHAILNR